MISRGSETMTVDFRGTFLPPTTVACVLTVQPRLARQKQIGTSRTEQHTTHHCKQPGLGVSPLGCKHMPLRCRYYFRRHENMSPRTDCRVNVDDRSINLQQAYYWQCSTLRLQMIWCHKASDYIQTQWWYITYHIILSKCPILISKQSELITFFRRTCRHPASIVIHKNGT